MKNVKTASFRATIIPVWLSFALIISPGCFYTGWEATEYGEVAKRQKVVLGNLIKFHPEDHAEFDYYFKVETAPYQGRDFLIGRVGGTENLGKVVPVFYDPLDPTQNNLSGFQTLANGIYYISIVWLFALAGMIFITYSIRRNMNKKDSGSQ